MRRARATRADEAAVRLPHEATFAGLLPSARSIVVSLVIAALALLAYIGARETSVFAVRTIEIEGARPAVAHRVRVALRPIEGMSLLDVDPADVTRLATTLPSVAGASVDRAFPNTLRVHVEPEQPLAVVRSGVDAWLVSRRGRAMSRIAQGTHRDLPRIWLDKSVGVALGDALAAGAGAEEVAALAPVEEPGLERRIASVRVAGGQYVYRLRGGLELRVGRPVDLALKLAIAARILEQTPVSGYLDVSVVERPVAGVEPQP